MVPQPKSQYPRQYRNQEGSAESPRQNFQAWETHSGQSGAASYAEYPVTPNGVQSFDYNRKTATARQIDRPIHKNDRGRVVKTPLNNAGPIRAIAEHKDGKAVGDPVGVLYHPQGNVLGYQRGTLQKLDQGGRATVREQKEYELRKVRTLK